MMRCNMKLPIEEWCSASAATTPRIDSSRFHGNLGASREGFALADLRLERLDVIHAGERTFPLAERVRAVPIARMLQDLRPLG